MLYRQSSLSYTVRHSLIQVLSYTESLHAVHRYDEHMSYIDDPGTYDSMLYLDILMSHSIA